jgi:two-component system, NtrC family, sensor kinase
MTALPPDVVADLSRLVSELEQRLEQSFAAHDEAIAQQTAAAQENALLRDELAAAREREAASAEILRTISGVSRNAEQSLPQIAEITARLFGASSVRIRLVEDGEWGSTFHVGRSSEAITSIVPDAKARIGGRNLPGTVVAENRQIHIPDLDNIDPEMADWPGLPPARAAGARTVSGTPLRRDGNAIGVLLIHRDYREPFSEAELALQQSFADQAAIAVENSRLFIETREALERQTATADILKVIASSPSDIQPVFEAIATSANRLVSGFSTTVFRFVDGLMHLKAFTPTNPAADELLQASFPRPLAEFPIFELVRDGRTMQFADTDAESGVHPSLRDLARSRGYRSMLFVPLMSNGASIGMIGLTRPQPGSFAPHHVQLLQTFADQAVIAIENVRLFDEVQEALQHQTATADVLKVISRSVFDLQTVLDTLVESAYKLCGANLGLLYLRGDEAFECKATAGMGVAQANLLFKGRPIRAGRGTAAERVILTGEVQSITDFFEDPEFDPRVREAIRSTTDQDSSLGQLRSTLAVPMTRDNAVVGVIVIARSQVVGPFPQRQIELLQTFADQAVIAIENARLFDEVQAKTADLTEALTYQTGSGNILRVIASSPTDVEPVLNAIVESACELCEAEDAIVFLLDDGDLRSAAHHGPIPEGLTRLPISRTRIVGRAFLDRKPVHVRDFHSVEGAEFPDGQAIALRLGHRTMLAVPLLREGESIGTITLRRNEVHPFSDKQITLLQTFADQAVIAIGNVRLFEQVQARTRELAASLDELRTAQDRLVQTEKLASLGQLTAGIAHEIKNPLNFVNNFAALSAELTDELNDVLKPATISDKIREEVDELTGLLKDNLEKVVQHGKRADSIVKNMLLHSREGSGDHRPADINALVDESLNLAYHGARAEKPQFNVTLQRNFDPNAGMIEMFPQEITRVFLNLIANGFYAVNKRKTENNEEFDPVVSATTTDRGSHVEIRIRDNGTGIPDEVKEKMFNPFFTTKPAGEGTGLGLSMSHDIIVKQHGGTIDVATEPGQFTEFTVVLPRTSNPPSKT